MYFLLYLIPAIVAALLSNMAICVAQSRAPMARDQAAIAFIQNLGSQGLQTLQWPEPQRSMAFRQLFEANFEVPAMARFALGQYARSLDQRQQSQYIDLFREYAVMSTIQKLSNYRNTDFRVTGSRPYGGNILVTSQAVPGGGRQPVQIDWSVADHGGRYLVSDIFIDGVSMKIAYRDGFAGIIERNGGRPEALLAVLRQMIDPLRQ
jgi:phospholipid transport system substrate-binding protein